MSDCIFCEIVAGRSPASVVCGDDRVLAFMDIGQINPGHVLVVPKKHYASLGELPEDIGAHLFVVAMRVAEAVRHAGVRCEGVNFFLADGEAAGQEIFHCHMHVLPRYPGDSFHIELKPRKMPTRQELDALAGQIGAAYRNVSAL